MNDYSYSSKNNLPGGAQEITMRARRMEREQALWNAQFEAGARAEKRRKRSLIQWIIFLFGAQRTF